MMIVISMFDESGNALRPWAERGATCYAVDWQNEERVEIIGDGCIIYLNRDLSKRESLLELIALAPAFVMGFPDCTHMAVSGAKHFAIKLANDPWIQIKSVQLARTVEFVGNSSGCPWMLENPRSVLSTMWRKRDYAFDPYMYGGYLDQDDIHPRWPEYIAPRDAYPKDTWIWCGNGFIMPKRIPVDVAPGYSTQFHKLGGKSKKTKQIRSETPRGFAIAVWQANWYRALKYAVDRRFEIA